MREFIGGFLIHKKFVKPEFLQNDNNLIFARMYKNKRYGATIELDQSKDLLHNVMSPSKEAKKKWAKMTDKQKERYEKKREERWNKPVYTKNWRRPKEIDRRIIIAQSLFELIVTKDEEKWKRGELYGRIGALFWDIHAHDPPRFKRCGFVNYAFDIDVDEIIKAMKGTEQSPIIKAMNRSFIKKGKRKYRYDVKKVRKRYQDWLKKTTKEMIRFKLPRRKRTKRYSW